MSLLLIVIVVVIIVRSVRALLILVASRGCGSSNAGSPTDILEHR